MGRRKKAIRAEKAEGLSGLQEAAAKKWGSAGPLYTGAHADRRQVGVPLQSLSLEYLLGWDKLLVGKVYGISGPPQSFKSALMLDFGRQLASMNGEIFEVETEGEKISPELLQSIFGEYANRILLRPVVSVDKAQESLTWFLEWVQKQYPEKTQLFGAFIDSLMGSATEERAGKIFKEGYAQKDFASEALMWTNWLKVVSSNAASWPIVYMYVNHEKPKINDKTGYMKNRPGGSAQEFHATVYLSVHRVKEHKGSTRTVTQINIRVIKHSFGEANRSVSTLFVYDFSDEKPKLFFDWEHSTAQLLIEHKTRVKHLLEVTSPSDNMTNLNRVFSCKQLGLVGVSGTELGAAVHSNHQLMAELRKAFRITAHDLWDGYLPPPNDNGVAPEVIPDLDADSVDLD